MTAKQDKAAPDLIAPHGGYRDLKSYQNAEIVYDATVRFCDRFGGKKRGGESFLTLRKSGSLGEGVEVLPPDKIKRTPRVTGMQVDG